MTATPEAPRPDRGAAPEAVLRTPADASPPSDAAPGQPRETAPATPNPNSALLPAAIVCFVLLLAFATARHIFVEYQAHLNMSMLHLSASARIFGERVSASIHGAETALEVYAYLHEKAPPGSIDRTSLAGLPLQSDLDGFILLDATCTVRAFSGRMHTPTLVDSAALCETLRTKVRKMEIAQPATTASEGQLLLGLKLGNDASRFDGMIAACMTPGHIGNPLLTGGDRELATTPDIITLHGPADWPIATWQRVNGPGIDITVDLDRLRDAGNVHPLGDDDTIAMVYDLARYPVSVIAGIRTRRALALWREQSVRQAVSATSVCVAIITLGLLAMRQKRRRLTIEQALAESEGRYRALAEHFPDGAVMLFDAAMRCTLANGTGLASLGLDGERTEGRRPHEFLPTHAAASFAEALATGLRGVPGRTTLSLGERILEVYCNPVPHDEAQPLCVVVFRDVTVAEQARRDLRDSAYRLNEAQRIARLGSFEVNFTTGVCTWSHELLRLVDVTPESAPGSLVVFIERFAPEQRSWLETLIHTPLRDPLLVTEHSFPFRTAEDRHRHARLHLHLHRGVGGLPAVGYGTMQDITELHEATEALKHREADLNEALHIARMASFSHDHASGATRFSTTLLHLLEAEGSPLTADELLRTLAPDLLSVVRGERSATPAQTPATADGLRVTMPFRTLAGDERQGQLHLHVLRDAAGHPLLTRGALQDITYRVSIENALRRSESSYRALADNMPNGVVLLVDQKGMLRVAAGQALGLLTRETPCTTGSPLGATLPASLVERLAPLVDDARHGKTERCELPHAGAVFEVVALPLPVEEDAAKDTEAEPGHRGGLMHDVMLLLQDVTRRKEWEEQMCASRDEAAAMSELKSQFVANISHEMRTPLSGILGIAEVALTGDMPREQLCRYFGMVQNVAEGLLGVINDLLDFSRLEAGRMPLDKVTFDLPATVKEALEPLAVQAERKGIGLEVHMQAGVPENLRGDPLRLRQILVNLTGNAIKFTDRGGVRVDVAPGDGVTHSRDDLVFTVEDSGSGIPSDKLMHIFESFAQADGSYSRRHTGSGLGLAISRHLVELQGGEIGVESTPGEGSVFWFTLPLDDAAPSKPGPRRRLSLGEPLRSRPVRVLLAEDNDLNREFITLFLEEGGHAVLQARDGHEALDVLHREVVDIVLMDVQMPQLNGIEATRRIRASGLPWSDVPVIALTAHSMAGDRERFMAAGMNDFVGKPVSRDELLAAVARNAPSPVAEHDDTTDPAAHTQGAGG